MNKKILSLFLALAGAAALAGPREFKSDYFPLEKNIAVDIFAPGAVRADIAISIPSLKEAQHFEIVGNDGRLKGGVYIPAGKENLISVVAFDERGEQIYSGSGYAAVDEKLTRQITIKLDGRETRESPDAKFASYRLELGLGPNEADGYRLAATLFDANGQRKPFGPDDIKWQYPEWFELLPYSCFKDSLCIDLPDPKYSREIIACWLDVFCQPNPEDYRGPYQYVSAGSNHTCALTRSNEIRCWGDNAIGQLGAPTAVCPEVNRMCSSVPIPVVCPAGESCRFRSVSAGGDHTCAVDTNGKAWCWGDTFNVATGRYGNAPPDSPAHWHIPAVSKSGVTADFLTIDTTWQHTCALSAAHDVFCWGSNFHGQLGVNSGLLGETTSARLVDNGKLYKMVTVGTRHSCALQISGSLDCWGANREFQVTGKQFIGPFVFDTVNPIVPLLNNGAVPFMATGGFGTCTQNAGNQIVCWGSPPAGNAPLIRTPGFVALNNASATSLSTEADFEGAPFADKTRTCVTNHVGELRCGIWQFAIKNPLMPVLPAADPRFFTQVDVGQNHTCAIDNQFDVYCFGSNAFGQFGTGTFDSGISLKPGVAANR